MRRRIRVLLVPALLLLTVSGLTLALFGGAARASSPAPHVGTGPQNASAPTTLAPGTSHRPLGNTGGTPYSDTELGAGGLSGQQMFVQSCASCHGTDAQGTARAPTLLGLGSATVDFWIITGRMPLAVPTEQALRKNPIFSLGQARQIARYVSSLQPGGPSIPSSVSYQQASLQQGGELFRLNCATCHSFTANGGALSYGAFAPTLTPDSPLEIAEAIRTGPGNMPRFTVQQLSNHDMSDIIRYVQYVKHPVDRGGFNLGHIGPTTEGYVGIVLGVGLLMLAAFWIGDRI